MFRNTKIKLYIEQNEGHVHMKILQFFTQISSRLQKQNYKTMKRRISF